MSSSPLQPHPSPRSVMGRWRHRTAVFAVVLGLPALLSLPTGISPAAAQSAQTQSAQTTTSPSASQVEADPAAAYGDSGHDSTKAPAGSAAVQVERAQEDLSAAQQQMAEIQAQLDDFAAQYEEVRAHAITIDDELERANSRIDAAEQQEADAHALQQAQLREAYITPGLDVVRVSSAFLHSEDAASALHNAALMTTLIERRSEVNDEIARASAQVRRDVSNQQNIASGSAATLQNLAGLTTAFGNLLADAEEQVAQARENLDIAEANVEAERAQAQAQQQQQVLMSQSANGVRLATIHGGTQRMACPIAQPNSFIDSWGFPRSGGRRHKGVDMFAAHGVPLYAAADGYIRRVYNNRLGGLSIDLVDVLGNRYYYAHLSAAYVNSSQRVEAGQLIGANGNSGNARTTPPHLHWQYHPGNGGPVNPTPLASALCR